MVLNLQRVRGHLRGFQKRPQTWVKLKALGGKKRKTKPEWPFVDRCWVMLQTMEVFVK